MKEFIEKKFVKFCLGSKEVHCHIDAVHASPPKHDKFTGDIVEGIAKEINCSAIIATVSRTIADINRSRNEENGEAIDEYRASIRQILEHLNIIDIDGTLLKPYLHLAIHGMKDKNNNEIEIGTRYGATCSEHVKNWVVEEIIKSFTSTGIDRNFPGDPSKSVHRLGDLNNNQNYSGYRENFNTIQLEFSLRLRQNHRKEIIKMLGDLILKFSRVF